MDRDGETGKGAKEGYTVVYRDGEGGREGGMERMRDISKAREAARW